MNQESESVFHKSQSVCLTKVISGLCCVGFRDYEDYGAVVNVQRDMLINMPATVAPMVPFCILV